jgi:hypothetical protein
MDLIMNKPIFGSYFRWTSLLGSILILLSVESYALRTTYGVTAKASSAGEYRISGNSSFRSYYLDNKTQKNAWGFSKGDAAGTYGPLTCASWGCYNSSNQTILVAVNAMLRGGDDPWCVPSLYLTNKAGKLTKQIGTSGLAKTADYSAMVAGVIQLTPDTGVAIGGEGALASFYACKGPSTYTNQGNRSITLL